MPDAIPTAARALWDYLENELAFCDCSDGGSCITWPETHRLNELQDALGAALGAPRKHSGEAVTND